MTVACDLNQPWTAGTVMMAQTLGRSGVPLAPRGPGLLRCRVTGRTLTSFWLALLLAMAADPAAAAPPPGGPSAGGTPPAELRGLWIVRINAAARQNGMSYGRFVDSLKRAGIIIDRKILADIAVRDEGTFTRIVEVAKGA